MGYKALSPQPQLGQLCRAVPADALELSAGPAKASVTAQLLPLPSLTSLTTPNRSYSQSTLQSIYMQSSEAQGLFLGDSNLYQYGCLEALQTPSAARLDPSEGEVLSQEWQQKDIFLLLGPQDLGRADSGARPPPYSPVRFLLTDQHQ